jgi:uncharacterized protein (DUF1778 family)
MAKKKRTNSTPLQVRITPELKKLFERAADKDRRSLSDWARLRLEKCASDELAHKEP